MTVPQKQFSLDTHCGGMMVKGLCKWCGRPARKDDGEQLGPAKMQLRCERPLESPRPSYDVEAEDGQIEIRCKGWQCPRCRAKTILRADQMADSLKALDGGAELKGICNECGATFKIKNKPQSRIVTATSIPNRRQRRAMVKARR